MEARSQAGTAAQPLRVLIDAADGAYTRQVLEGLLPHAQAQRWQVRWQAGAGIADLRAWQPQGIITDSAREGWLKELQSLGAPLVSIGRQVPGITASIVGNDDRAIGACAARHLWERGFRRFATAGDRRLWLVRERLTGFAARLLSESSFPHLPCSSEGGSWRQEDGAVAVFLRRLPRPCAIFCADSDRTAWRALQVAEQTGLRVPEDVAVLGVGNDLLDCLSSQPAISSVVLPTARIGALAAAALAAAMAGARSHEAVRLPPAGVAARGSTGMAGVGDAVVAQVLRWMRERYQDRGVTAATAAHAAAISPRTLERRFREHLQRTPSDMLDQFRLERAEELMPGDLDLVQIARACGFPSRKALASAVRRARGMTCAARRRQLRD